MANALYVKEIKATCAHTFTFRKERKGKSKSFRFLFRIVKQKTMLAIPLYTKKVKRRLRKLKRN